MNLTFSNIAWNKKENNKIINLFLKYNIKHLEFAPNLILDNNYSKKNINSIKKFWKKKNFLLYSMQSIFYNIDNAYIFGKIEQQKKFVDEFKKKIRLTNILGVKIIIFGSPKTKKIFGRSKKKLDLMFEKTLRKIIKICSKFKITLCLEANPEIYGTKYLTHTSHALNFVKKINNKYFKLNLDLGTVIANNENYEKIVRTSMPHIGHVQISSPNLKNPLNHRKLIKKFVQVLNKNCYNNFVSVEFLRNNKNNFKNIIELISLIKNA